MAQTPNLFVLAADNSPNLIPLLQEQPQRASFQDEHGYSLLHAAASYNHVSLVRRLVSEFGVDPDIKDEDGETALFLVETVEAAKALLDDAKTDPAIRNKDGMTAEEKIVVEGDFVVVADFLRECRIRQGGGESGPSSWHSTAERPNDGEDNDGPAHPLPLPANVTATVGTMNALYDDGEVADPEIKRMIEELAAREDFQGEEGQKRLREVVLETVKRLGLRGESDRDVRRRTE